MFVDKPIKSQYFIIMKKKAKFFRFFFKCMPFATNKQSPRTRRSKRKYNRFRFLEKIKSSQYTLLLLFRKKPAFFGGGRAMV